MLAQNFKTAEDLGITEAKVGALIKVLGRLERGELNHSFEINTPTGFNMANYFATAECGTIGCIAGWADSILPEREHFMGVPWKDKLAELFHGGENPRSVTPEQAAIALRSYLTTGEARWDLAVTS